MGRSAPVAFAARSGPDGRLLAAAAPLASEGAGGDWLAVVAPDGLGATEAAHVALPPELRRQGPLLRLAVLVDGAAADSADGAGQVVVRAEAPAGPAWELRRPLARPSAPWAARWEARDALRYATDVPTAPTTKARTNSRVELAGGAKAAGAADGRVRVAVGGRPWAPLLALPGGEPVVQLLRFALPAKPPGRARGRMGYPPEISTRSPPAQDVLVVLGAEGTAVAVPVVAGPEPFATSATFSFAVERGLTAVAVWGRPGAPRLAYAAAGAVYVSDPLRAGGSAQDVLAGPHRPVACREFVVAVCCDAAGEPDGPLFSLGASGAVYALPADGLELLAPGETSAADGEVLGNKSSPPAPRGSSIVPTPSADECLAGLLGRARRLAPGGVAEAAERGRLEAALARLQRALALAVRQYRSHSAGARSSCSVDSGTAA